MSKIIKILRTSSLSKIIWFFYKKRVYLWKASLIVISIHFLALGLNITFHINITISKKIFFSSLSLLLSFSALTIPAQCLSQEKGQHLVLVLRPQKERKRLDLRYIIIISELPLLYRACILKKIHTTQCLYDCLCTICQGYLAFLLIGNTVSYYPQSSGYSLTDLERMDSCVGWRLILNVWLSIKHGI